MMKGNMCVVHKVAGLLLFVGGLNWGLVAINPAWNLVDMLLGTGSMAARVVYGLVGISALVMLGCMKCCMKGGMCSKCGGNCMGGKCSGGACKGGKCDGKMEKGAQCSGTQVK